MSRQKTYVDQEGRALPYPWTINNMLALVGGSQTIRLKIWSRKPKHAAEKLFLSESTVKTHISNIYRKTGVHSQQELLDKLDKM